MIKDIEYAFFSQLSYLNWNKLDKNDFKFYKSYQDKKLIEFLNLKAQVWNKVNYHRPNRGRGFVGSI